MIDLRSRLVVTVRACRFALERLDGIVVAVVTGLGYLLAYLWMTDLLTIRADADVGWLFVDDPLVRALERRGPLSFEPIALLEFGYGTLLVSPIDASIGLMLAMLVGLNLALAYLAIVQPAACGVGAGAGIAASVPALLSGTVCCAPALVLALGIQVSGALLATLPWLLPVGVLLLLGSLGYVAGKINVVSNGERDTDPAGLRADR
ncbi:hypothetical protein [Natronobacterium texcoconense]|uniref:Uncharacterized protein n=1 Tax=Natronobacterium texcoconense TaxID=1095778 RepID=A0A1H0ZWX0_NATTX|nr:hypothetical protein [Natronobacterium texcoconense]SDQ31860.1 hypothetical protein SAMN04489842_0466 [Natronobacterium texcoconense]